MASVRDWTVTSGFDYRFVEFDDLLAAAPEWLRDRCGDSLVHPVLDFARVRCAERFVESGWHRAVWIDGDVLVARPERLELPADEGAAFMAETWTLWQGDEFVVKQRLTNCICSFVAGDPFTRRYIDMMTSVGQAESPLTKAALGTELLTALPEHERPAVIPNVGNLSPHALAAIANQDTERVTALLEATGEPMYAVNICASHEGNTYAGVFNTAEVYEKAVQLLQSQPDLLSARGATRHLRHHDT
jgi:hypothetical protein